MACNGAVEWGRPGCRRASGRNRFARGVARPGWRQGLSGPEKVVIRSNALKSLQTSRFPEIRFTADVIDKTDEGYRLTGRLEVRDKAREHVIDLRTEDLGDSWRISAESEVRQSDYGIKPYSILMGSVQVADDVTVSFTAVHAKDD